MHKIAFAPLLCGCVAMAGGLIPGLLDGLIRGDRGVLKKLRLVRAYLSSA